MTPDERATQAGGLYRMNWGCGSYTLDGWFNSDLKDDPGIDLSGDIRDGLGLPDETFDYIVSVHALPMISIPDLPTALRELRRVLRPEGTLRLCLPDFDRAIDAYRAGDRDYFLVPDADEPTLSGKLVTQLLWYGWSTTLFTSEWAESLLDRAKFAQVDQCSFGVSASNWAGICELDNREHESFFIEARR